MQPELIGERYRVGIAVGRGGMGTVWLCRDERLQRDVAVKQVGLLPGESVTDSARALREARSSAALSHRNVVTVYDVVEEGGAIWLVMEYVPSRSLADLVAAEGALDPASVADIGAQVADGLAAAHALGVMHRDVKPGNVLVREDGLAKISDFGIARSAGDPALTQSGLLTGTPSYFSPELARGAAPTPASDVWALGATLYAAVEGHPPYPPQGNPIAVLNDIANRQPGPPRRAGFLEPALLRMLDRDPGSRWAMDDAAHGLRRLADSHRTEQTLAQTRLWTRAEPARPTVAAGRKVQPPVASGPTSERPREASAAHRPPPAAPHPTARGGSSGGPRRRGLSVLLAALAALLVLAGAGYVLSRGGSENGRTASGDPTSSPRPSASSTGTASPSPSKASKSPSASSATGSPASSPSGSGSADLAAKAAFLRGYFQVAGTDAGWAQLGPGEKAGGRASYNTFWGAIDSATVSNVSAAQDGGDPDTVDATIRYTWSDGRVVEERQRLSLLRSGDGLLVDNDDVLSSRTVSQ